MSVLPVNPPNFGEWQQLEALPINKVIQNLIRAGYESSYQRRTTAAGDDEVRQVQYLTAYANVSTWSTGDGSALNQFIFTGAIVSGSIVVNIGSRKDNASDISTPRLIQQYATYPATLFDPWRITQSRIQDNGDNTSKVMYTFYKQADWVIEI